MCLLLKPNAATVPRIVEPIVAKKAIIILFFAANPHAVSYTHLTLPTNREV